MKIKDKIIQGKRPKFSLAGDGTLRFGMHLYVPNEKDLKKEIMV